MAISEVIWICWQINKWPLRPNWLCFKRPSCLKISWLLKSLCPLFSQERAWHRQKLATRLKWRLLFSHITAAIYKMIILKLSFNPQCLLWQGTCKLSFACASMYTLADISHRLQIIDENSSWLNLWIITNLSLEHHLYSPNTVLKYDLGDWFRIMKGWQGWRLRSSSIFAKHCFSWVI